jgi:hypothetical protein
MFVGTRGNSSEEGRYEQAPGGLATRQMKQRKRKREKSARARQVSKRRDAE